MSYIGVPPQATFSSGLLDRFTSTTGTTVTLTHDIASENDIVVFVNFVKQDSTTYSVGGTGNKTLTLGGTLVSSDIVEVHYLNIVGQTNAPSSGSVGSSQISADVITGQTALATTPADTDEFLVSDAGTLKRIDYSLIKGGGITQTDQWRLTNDITSNTDPITSNLERVDDASFGYIGSGMSVSSGIWTFPSTGIYQILVTMKAYSTDSSDTLKISTYVSTDSGGSYDEIGETAISSESGSAVGNTATTPMFVDVTNTSTVKVKFTAASLDSGSVIEGDTAKNKTCFTFIRMGDT